MQPGEPEGSVSLPLRAVIDSCVFPGTREWLATLIADARAGYVEPIWAPAIIAETNRVLTWLWLERHGGGLSATAKRACSADARTMFSWLTRVFRVAEDCPPYEALWTLQPRDEWDVPIWTAALRARARFVVTLNLRDGPPAAADGVREYRGIYCLHPRTFLELVDRLATEAVAAEMPELPTDEPPAHGLTAPPPLRDLIAALQRPGSTA